MSATAWARSSRRSSTPSSRCTRLGYPLDHPIVKQQIARAGEAGDRGRRDAARAALLLSGLGHGPTRSTRWSTPAWRPTTRRCCTPPDWMLDQRGHGSGDWRVKNREVRAPGWFFEYANPFYPDCDTTAQVLIGAAQAALPRPTRRRRASARSTRRTTGTSRCRTRTAAGAPSTATATRSCSDLRSLRRSQRDDRPQHQRHHRPRAGDARRPGLPRAAIPPARRAIDFLLREQEADGSWFGRWGCNYLYGTYLAAWSLVAIGEDPIGAVGPSRRRLAAQLPERGRRLGRDSRAPTTTRRRRGIGPSTASQTAWALLGLIAAGRGRDRRESRRGIDTWCASSAPTAPGTTSTGPAPASRRVFYLRYHLYAIYFPLLALALLSASRRADRGARAVQDRLTRERRGPEQTRPMRFPLHITTDNVRHQVRERHQGQPALPLRADARAALHLQPGLPGLRHRAAHRQARGPALRRGLPQGGRRLRRAPGVSICGGEPTVYPELKELIDGIIDRRAAHLPLHQRPAAGQEGLRRDPAEQAADASTSTSTACARPTTWSAPARASSTTRSR